MQRADKYADAYDSGSSNVNSNPEPRTTEEPRAAEAGKLSKGGWSLGVSIFWLVGFSFFFYTLSPPILGGVSRNHVWSDSAVVFDLIDPPDEHDSWSNLTDRVDLILSAGLILAGAWGGGHLLLRLLRVPLDERCLERTTLAWALGLSALSLLTLLCGLAGYLSRGLLVSLFIAAAMGESFLRVRPKRRGGRDGVERVPLNVNWGVLVTIAPFLLVMLLGAMLPSADFDVKEYHLEGPKEFFLAGRISMLPHNVYTSFPFLTEMLSLLGMVVRDDWYRGALVGKLLLMCFQPLTAMTLLAAGRRWFGSRAGWLALFVFLTVPWIHRISIIAYTEGGLSCFLFTSTFAAMLSLEAMAQRRESGRMVLLAGLLAGSAMACKYTGLLQVVLPIGAALCLAPWLMKLSGERAGSLALRSAGMFCLGTACTIGPWLLKNVVETGNPVYPLAYSLFGGADWDAELDEKWRDAHGPKPRTLPLLGSDLLNVTARSDWLSALLYGLAPLAFLFHRNRKTICWLWVYLLFLFVSWWFFTHRIDRFWVPMLPVVALLAGIGASWSDHKTWRTVTLCCFLPTVVFNLAMVTSGASGFNRFHASLESARTVAESWPPGIRLLNSLNLPPRSRVLFVGEAQVFDARFPYVYNTVFDHSIFQQWCAAPEPGLPAAELKMNDPEMIRQRFAEAGITHVYVNWQEILRYRTTYRYTDFVTPKRFLWLQQQGILGPEIALPAEIQLGSFETLEQNKQNEIESWAPQLKTNYRGMPSWITGQLFPVLSPRTTNDHED